LRTDLFTGRNWNTVVKSIINKRFGVEKMSDWRKWIKKYTEGTLLCEKCGQPLRTCNALDKHNLIGYTYSCEKCEYSIFKVGKK